MPELPEVLHISRYLDTHLPGRQILDVRYLEDPDKFRLSSARAVRDALVGCTFEEVSHHGKLLLLRCRTTTLVIHLKMTGKLFVRSSEAEREKHVRWVLELSGNRTLHFEDMRKFGWSRLLKPDEVPEFLATYGPSPLELTGDAFEALISRRRGRLKPLLLNQRFLVGIGNIYADEILWTASLHPERRAATLTRPERDRLFQSICTCLKAAIDERQLDAPPDQRRVGGAEPRALSRVTRQVYGQAGEPCPRCGTPIERTVIGNRGTFCCPRCQDPASRKRASSG